MYVQVKSSNGITVVPMETKLMAERRIFIQGDITQENACEFVKQILLLNSQDSEKPIDVLVNSPGGEINRPRSECSVWGRHTAWAQFSSPAEDMEDTCFHTAN